MSLFGQLDRDDESADSNVPLAERMRPRTLSEFVGQVRVLSEGSDLRTAIESGEAGSLLLFGPPGCGKTSLARLIASNSEMELEPLSAVLSGVADVRKAVERARSRRTHEGRGTLLFVDEIHRFNKAQQDAFLPMLESGEITLIGATTENPSFSANAALLSRCRVVRLEGLADADLASLVRRALEDPERGLGNLRLSIDEATVERIVLQAGGDARRALNILEAAARAAARSPDARIDLEHVAEAAQERALAHDKSGDHHFDLLSAFHKSLRNSDVDAAVYWMARFLEAGAEGSQLARRMVAMAAEDIGLADPNALTVAVSALTAFERMGLPEGRLPLGQAAIYLASAPKSRSVYDALSRAVRVVQNERQHGVPDHLRNAPTKLAKELGHGQGYQFAPDQPGHVADMDCLPAELVGQRFFRPGEWGFEPRVQARLDEIAERRKRR
ncbi:MAG: replication-associated recombination protein A [Planctomycetota bacterium]